MDDEYEITLKKYRSGNYKQIQRFLNKSRLSQNFTDYFDNYDEAVREIRMEIRMLDYYLENAPRLEVQKILYSSNFNERGFFELKTEYDDFKYVVDKDVKFLKLDEGKYLFSRKLKCRDSGNGSFTLSDKEDFVPENTEPKNSSEIEKQFLSGENELIDPETNTPFSEDSFEDLYSSADDCSKINTNAKFIRIANQVARCDLSEYPNIETIGINSHENHITLPNQIKKLKLNCDKFNIEIPAGIQEIWIKSKTKYPISVLKLREKQNLRKLSLHEFNFANNEKIPKDVRLNELNLISCENITIPSITTLTILDISNNNLENLIGIPALRNLKELNISKNKIKSINLSNENLTKIIANNNNISSVKISECENLEELDLEKNNLNSIVLFNSKLKKLNISNNKLRSFNLIECNEIEELNISKNEIKILTISDIESLKKLDVSSNSIANLEIFCSNLEELHFKNNPFSRFILEAEKLTNLDLRNSGINAGTELEMNCENLKEINLTGFKLTNLDFLENSFYLREIYLNESKVTDISILSEMGDLRIVHIDRRTLYSLKNRHVSERFIFMP